MNKKNLSVVMAGAMLATSVVPVLAAETTTTLPSSISADNKAVLKLAIENLMDSKVVSNDSRLVDTFDVKGCKKSDGGVGSDTAHDGGTTPNAPINHGESVYGVQILDSKGNVKKISANDTEDGINYVKADVLTAIGKLAGGETVKIYERANNKLLGQYITTTLPEVNNSVAGNTYSAADIRNIAKLINGSWDNSSNNFEGSVTKNTYPGLRAAITAAAPGGADYLNQYIKGGSATTKVVDGKQVVTFELVARESASNESSNKTVTISSGDSVLDFNLPIGKDGDEDILLAAPENAASASVSAELKEDLQDCVGFYKTTAYKAETTELTADPTLANTVEITTSEDDSNVSYLASDLYDGFALTAKGTEIADMINSDKYEVKYDINDANSPNKEISNPNTSIVVDSATGICKLTITLTNKTDKTFEVYSTNAKEVQSLYRIINGDYNVGIIGGATRYETAVNVAKAQGLDKFDKDAATNNIVLVNGTSLVDGLAAAPLAATLEAYQDNNAASTTTAISAPVLLSETDKLPTATKEYLTELTEDIAPSALKNVTISLVGGKGVLSSNLETELKDMGFTVKRYGGDDREETSIKVASAIKGKDTKVKRVYVVGGNGEADAMSIASVASDKTVNDSKADGSSGADKTVMPIIVSSVHGVSDDAASYISDVVGTNGSATIIGGTSVVSSEDEEKIDNALSKGANPTSRIAGDTRFETNAKIIETYYDASATVKSVVMVKDGQKDKSELVDALSAANYAATNNGPIVLASKDVKDVQKNALLGFKSESSATLKKVVQIGQGAERTVLETIADLFGISNL